MDDLVKLKAPKGASVVGWAEKEYEVVRGCVQVETEAVEHLLAHGFTTVADAADKKDGAE